MVLKILGSQEYGDNTKNYGDCIVLINGMNSVVYDCGSEEHAKKVVQLLDQNNVDKVTVVLSHNDDDHFLGIPYLIEQGRVSCLFTVLLLKYKEELLRRIDDGGRNLDSIGKQIKEKYDNIASLSGKVTLLDVYESKDALPDCVEFVGPDFDYMLDAAAKGLDSREGDTIDLETVTNAASVQIKLKFGTSNVLLTGDCAPEAIPPEVDLSKCDYLQLPHHGKDELAQKMFERAYPCNRIVYFVSDNTGNSNGGSDKLKSKGHLVKSTKVSGTLQFSSTVPIVTHTGAKLGK